VLKLFATIFVRGPGKDSINLLRIRGLALAQDDVSEPHFEDFELKLFG
jgi:hypothetical protein